MGFGIDDLGNALGDAAQAGVSFLEGDQTAARNHLSDADAAITGDTSDAGAAAAQGTRQGATWAAEMQARSLQQHQQLLATSLQGSQDAQSVAGFENYAAHDHPELYAKAQEMSGPGSQDAAQGWTDLGTSLGSHFQTLGQTLLSVIANGWEGDGAAAAAASSARYVQQASALQPAFALTGSKLQEAAAAAGATHVAVPPPVEFNRTHAVTHGIASVLTGGSADADVKAQQGAMDAAHAEAVQVMVATYKPMMASADTGVPTFAAPSGPAGGDAAPTPSPGPIYRRAPDPAPWFPPTHPGGGSTGGPTNPHVRNGPGVPQQQTGQLAPSAPPTVGAGGSGAGYGPGAARGAGGAAGAGVGFGAGAGYGDVSGAGSGSGSSDGRPAAAVSSAGYLPPGFAAGGGQGGGGSAGYGSAGHGPGSGGYVNGPSGFGSAAGAGGFGGSAGAGGYGSGPRGSGGVRGGGGTGAVGSGTGVGGGVGAAGGAPGSGGGGASGPGPGSTGVDGGGAARFGSAGGMGGGRGMKGEEDFEHNTPSYLITDEHGSEIVGKLPTVSPAVIGE